MSTQFLIYAVRLSGSADTNAALGSKPVASRTVTQSVSVITDSLSTFSLSSSFSGAADNDYESALVDEDSESIVLSCGGIAFASTNDPYQSVLERMLMIQGGEWYPPLANPAFIAVGDTRTQACAVAHIGMPEPIMLGASPLPRVFNAIYVLSLESRIVTNNLRIDALSYSITGDDAVYVGTEGTRVLAGTNAVFGVVQSFSIVGSLVIDGTGILRDRDEVCMSDFKILERTVITNDWTISTGTGWKTRYEATLLE